MAGDRHSFKEFSCFWHEAAKVFCKSCVCRCTACDDDCWPGLKAANFRIQERTFYSLKQKCSESRGRNKAWPAAAQEVSTTRWRKRGQLRTSSEYHENLKPKLGKQNPKQTRPCLRRFVVRCVLCHEDTKWRRQTSCSDELRLVRQLFSEFLCFNNARQTFCVQPPGRQKIKKTIFNRLSQAVEEKRKEGHKVLSWDSYSLIVAWVSVWF